MVIWATPLVCPRGLYTPPVCPQSPLYKQAHSAKAYSTRFFRFSSCWLLLLYVVKNCLKFYNMLFAMLDSFLIDLFLIWAKSDNFIEPTFKRKYKKDWLNSEYKWRSENVNKKLTKSKQTAVYCIIIKFALLSLK